MRYSSLRDAFFILLSLEPLRVASASIPKLDGRGETSHQSPDVGLLAPQDTDLQPRSAADWVRRLEWAVLFGFIPGMTWSLYSAATACEEANEAQSGAKKVKPTVNCVGSVLAHIGTSALALGGGVIAVAHLSQDFRLPGPLQGLSQYLPHKAKREALAGLSEALGVEVRHLGHWTDTVTGLERRDETPVVRPVFGAKVRGVNIHFSVLDDREEDGNVTTRGLRIGFGHGGSGGLLGARDVSYFKEGGIDYEAQRIGPHKDIKPDADLFQSNYDQLDCYLHNKFSGDPMNANAVWVQIYDREAGGTALAVKYAVFGPNGQSGIKQMPWKGSLDVDYQCLRPLNAGGLDLPPGVIG
ncbi:hypothetical protein JX265_003084 [Neoarthrinium moseri]|uniref:Uncharacterized protein n=1 Tax=Neoarthrinium moseri TaxID=1658444 RepID=A0A9Q0ATR4_9PEZI|nr:hypothetical protein JX266_002143 [Neoarthrinium moseri]KAI1878907.1 hypothetical protein JX265_003084 [Neoarthrinium moseri]